MRFVTIFAVLTFDDEASSGDAEGQSFARWNPKPATDWTSTEFHQAEQKEKSYQSHRSSLREAHTAPTRSLTRASKETT